MAACVANLIEFDNCRPLAARGLLPDKIRAKSKPGGSHSVPGLAATSLVGLTCAEGGKALCGSRSIAPETALVDWPRCHLRVELDLAERLLVIGDVLL